MVERKRLEQDGLYVDSSDHWEMFDTKIYIREGISKQGYKTKARSVCVPIDIVRHLKLKNKDKIVVAIKRSE